MRSGKKTIEDLRSEFELLKKEKRKHECMLSPACEKDHVCKFDRRMDELKEELRKLGGESAAKPEQVAEPELARSSITNPADDTTMPHERSSFLDSDAFKQVKAMLTNDGWTCTDNVTDGKITSVTVTKDDKKDDPNYQFEIQQHCVMSQSTEKETFKAMLMAFKQLHPGVTPRIQTNPEENIKKWEDVYCEVYEQKSVPQGVVKFVGPKPAPEAKEETPPPRPGR